MNHSKFAKGLAVALSTVFVVAVCGVPTWAAEADPITADSSVSYQSEEIAAALHHSSSASTSEVEEVAVKQYLDSNKDADGPDIKASNLDVATVAEGTSLIVLVEPESGLRVSSAEVRADASTNDYSASVKFADDADSPSQSGPGMGTWPDWSSAFHSSVKLTIYYKESGSYVKEGTATFQTVRRQYEHDGDSKVDTYQVGRSGVAQPVAGRTTVQKLWASQQLTSDVQDNAREWMWSLTKPKSGFSECSDGVSVSLGWFSFTSSNCDDYDVWFGSVGHERFDMDQGYSASSGSRALGYTGGWTMDNGVAPSATYYEFVTFKINPEPHIYQSIKCYSKDRGPEGDTDYLDCKFTDDGEIHAS